MSSHLLPSADPCCTPCDEVPSIQVPGPAGANGSNGAAGTNGINAFTTTTANFTMPGEGLTVNVSVVSTAWIALTQLLYVQGAGWMRATAIPDATTVTLRNEENTASLLYTENAAPATIIASGARVSPGGLQGPAGSITGAFAVANNLSEGTPATMRSNLGLGSIATQAASAVAITGGSVAGITDLAVADGGTGASTAAGARTNLGLVIGTDVQAFDADLSIYAGISPSANVQTLLAAATFAAFRSSLGVNRTLQDYLLYEHQLASGTGGGDFNSGAWQTTPLNTELFDTGAHGAVAANIVTLQPGTYRFRGRVCGYDVDTFQSRLFNVDTASVIALGEVVRCAAAGDDSAYSEVRGRFTIAVATQIRLEGRCTTTNAGDGFGTPGSFGTEVYSSLELEREAG